MIARVLEAAQVTHVSLLQLKFLSEIIEIVDVLP